jgi:hypothetical protein
MSVCASRMRILRGWTKGVAPIADIPTFLCPGLLRTANLPLRNCASRCAQLSQHTSRRFLSSEVVDNSGVAADAQIQAAKRYEALAQAVLPRQCPGCGALSQNVLRDEAGYYDITRRGIRKFVVGSDHQLDKVAVEDEVVKKALENAGPLAAGLGLGNLQTEKPSML